MSMISKRKDFKTNGQLLLMKEQLKFNIAIQRNFVWDLDRKSLLIASILDGYPVPPVYVLDKGDNDLWFLDGKQRTSTILEYLQDGFQLTADVEPIDGIEIAGKAFSELDKDLQLRFQTEALDIVVLRVKADTEEQIKDVVDEIFYRLNNGMSLSKMEITRVLASSNVMDFVQTMLKESFFNKSISLTENMKKHFEDEELVLKLMMLVESEGKAIEMGRDKIKEFAVRMKEKGLSQNMKDTIKTVIEYLNKAFPTKEGALKKSHIPSLFVQAIKAIEQNITPEKFGGWAIDFLLDRMKGSKYATANRASTGKISNVAIRLAELNKDYDQFIEKAGNYMTPDERAKHKKAEAERQRLIEEAKKKGIIVPENGNTSNENQNEQKNENQNNNQNNNDNQTKENKNDPKNNDNKENKNKNNRNKNNNKPKTEPKNEPKIEPKTEPKTDEKGQEAV